VEEERNFYYSKLVSIEQEVANASEQAKQVHQPMHSAAVIQQILVATPADFMNK
jgi:hypothetical protein